MTARPLRSRQHRLAGVIAAIASGQTDARDILAAVTSGGGKSLDFSQLKAEERNALAEAIRRRLASFSGVELEPHPPVSVREPPELA